MSEANKRLSDEHFYENPEFNPIENFSADIIETLRKMDGNSEICISET